jgi:hypothetical protein
MVISGSFAAEAELLPIITLALLKDAAAKVTPA